MPWLVSELLVTGVLSRFKQRLLAILLLLVRKRLIITLLRYIVSFSSTIRSLIR
jgi:hypothetical protein